MNLAFATFGCVLVVYAAVAVVVSRRFNRGGTDRFWVHVYAIALAATGAGALVGSLLRLGSATYYIVGGLLVAGGTVRYVGRRWSSN